MNQRNWSVPTILILGICYKLNKILNHASNWYQIMHLIDMHNSMQAIIGFHTSDMSQIVSAKFWFIYTILYFIYFWFSIFNVQILAGHGHGLFLVGELNCSDFPPIFDRLLKKEAINRKWWVLRKFLLQVFWVSNSNSRRQIYINFFLDLELASVSLHQSFAKYQTWIKK